MPTHAPGGSKLMVSTQPVFVAHTDNHGVDQGRILSDQQLLFKRCLWLNFKWNLTVSPAITKQKEKGSHELSR